MPKRKLKKTLFVMLPMAGALAILAALVYPNLDALLATIKAAAPFYLACSLFFSFAGYLFMGLSLREVLNLLGHRLSVWDATGVSLVSSAVNYFVSSGGVSGFAVRAHLLSKHRVPYGKCVTSSVVSSVFIYLVLALIIMEGILLQALKSNNYGVSLFTDIAGVLLVLAFAFFLAVMFFHHKLRSSWGRKLYHLVNWVSYLFSRKGIPEETFLKFEAQLAEGIHTIQTRKYELPLVLAYICLDWVSNILILHFAFMAIGVHLHTSTLIIGFALGQLMTIIPVLPGGLGAMEAAMTGAFTGMGQTVGQALAASLIFRCFYYIIPSFVSVFMYWEMRRETAGPKTI